MIIYSFGTMTKITPKKEKNGHTLKAGKGMCRSFIMGRPVKSQPMKEPRRGKKENN